MMLALSGAWFWVAVVVLAAASIASTCGAAWLVWRRALEAHPEEHAFLSMARRVGLRRREREAVRALAAGAGLPPVALLLAPSTLERACRAAPEGEFNARLLARAEAWGAG